MEDAPQAFADSPGSLASLGAPSPVMPYDEAEGDAEKSTVPTWLKILLFVLAVGAVVAGLGIAMGWFAGDGGEKDGDDDDAGGDGADLSRDATTPGTAPPGTAPGAPPGTAAPGAPPALAPEKHYLAASCPAGWEELGTMGVLISNANRSAAPFAVGGSHHADWPWMHPKLCRGRAAAGNVLPAGLFKFAASGSIKVGILSSNRAPATRASPPLPLGGAHNSDWTWAHPFLVPASDPGGLTVWYPRDPVVVGLIHRNTPPASFTFPFGGAYNDDWTWNHPFLVPDGPGSAAGTIRNENEKYYLAATCPAGWEELGTMGLLISNANRSAAPFTVGGSHHADWPWMHPKLCRRTVAAGEAIPAGLFKFAATGTIKVGILSSNGAPATRTSPPLPLGGSHHSDWTWAHPFLVPASDPGGFMVWYPRTPITTGMIHRNGAPTTFTFPFGGAYNNDWTWNHPLLLAD